MKERILAFLQNENKSYAQFAEEIGVQPSGISHILSGRNNPSLDFIVKMLQKYQSLSAEWLLFGRGAMYKNVVQPTLFDTEPEIESVEPFLPESDAEGPPEPEKLYREAKNASDSQGSDEYKSSPGERKLTRVLFFYSDKTFTQYRPE